VEKSSNERSRLYVDVPADLRRRVRVAAAHEDVTLHDYVVRSLEHALRCDQAAQDGGCDEAQGVVGRLRVLQHRVFASGALADDSVEILRAERERESYW
jgi:hypothetical protein